MRHELRRAIASISWLLSQSYGMAALTTVIVVLADRSDAFVTSAIVETIPERRAGDGEARVVRHVGLLNPGAG